MMVGSEHAVGASPELLFTKRRRGRQVDAVQCEWCLFFSRYPHYGKNVRYKIPFFVARGKVYVFVLFSTMARSTSRSPLSVTSLVKRLSLFLSSWAGGPNSACANVSLASIRLHGEKNRLRHVQSPIQAAIHH